MIAFQPTGTILGFTAATTAPTSVQIVNTNAQGTVQVMLTNTDSAVDAVIGWGSTDAIAKLNAGSVSAATAVQNKEFCYFLLHSTQVVVSVPQGSFFSGITGSSTAAIKVQAGLGN